MVGYVYWGSTRARRRLSAKMTMELLITFALICTAVATASPPISLQDIHVLQSTNPATVILIALMPPMQIMLIVIGFHYFEWWVWIAALLVARLLLRPVVALELHSKVFDVAVRARKAAMILIPAAWALHLDIL